MYRYVTEPILIGFDAQKADKLEESGRDNPGKDSPPTNPTPTNAALKEPKRNIGLGSTLEKIRLHYYFLGRSKL